MVLYHFTSRLYYKHTKILQLYCYISIGVRANLYGGYVAMVTSCKCESIVLVMLQSILPKVAKAS
jgi:hypothetical protein